MENISSHFLNTKEELLNPLGKVLSVAHRGHWQNNPENSLPAFESCIRSGIDMIELDVQKTLDGHLVVIHDKSVNRMTEGSGKVAEMTLKELQSLKLRNRQGREKEELTIHTIPTLLNTMEYLSGKICVTIDKGWPHREEIYNILKKTNSMDHTVIKSFKKAEEVIPWLQSKNPKPLYCAMIRKDNIDTVLVRYIILNLMI